MLFPAILLLKTNFYYPNDIKESFKGFAEGGISILYINIKSMKKTFESFKDLYPKMNYHLSILCFLEDEDETLAKNLFFHLESNNLVCQIISHCKDGASSIFFHKTFS